MDLHTLIGLAGVAGYVTAYAMLQLGFLDGNGVRYSVANVVAAALVLVSLTDEFNLASALIQVIWIVIGVSGLVLRAMRRRPTVYEPAETVSATTVSTQEDKTPALVSVRRSTSPFRSAPASDSGQPARGLRADVLQAYQAATKS